MAENAGLLDRLRRRVATLPKPRRLRRTSVAVLAVASLLTLMCVVLFGAMLVNDYKIGKRTGTAVAEVQAVTFARTIVRYNTPDGAIHSPTRGILYPSGLAEGNLVRVEYDLYFPDELVRVEGRNAWMNIWPVVAVIAGAWVIAYPLVRRLEKRRT
ncbi:MULTISPECIES: DUF3592 domain-containing protein [unclassified Crossiella]|uniref:DUF3592 domain-containing protein n=1 Tax=unclassified Crossiella TaxID=2620835 RepID=UPI001FFEA5F0|nr:MULTISPECIES: DUF3592 domain-containing protein [unclassified Crossiella]MCK2236763.1 hypothetical protein [Crossiella sp. S99.2]MCK2250431.1 hypothetical protein [Crossiella sp. S99.1]